MLRVRDDAIPIDLTRVDLPAIALWNHRLQRRAERRVDRFEAGRQRIVDDEPVDGVIDDRTHADVKNLCRRHVEISGTGVRSIVAAEALTAPKVATPASLQQADDPKRGQLAGCVRPAPDKCRAAV